jgi:hypothetical protein
VLTRKNVVLLFFYLLAACGPNSNSVSLVQGDIAIDVLISQSYNVNTHDLSGTVVSLKDNASTILFDYSRGVEPGLTSWQYVKVRSQSNYPINYQIEFLLTAPLNGDVFFFKVKELNQDNQSTTLINTTNQQYASNTILATRSFDLFSRGSFDIFFIELIINPNLGNTFNLENPNLEFAFSILFVGEYNSASS